MVLLAGGQLLKLSGHDDVHRRRVGREVSMLTGNKSSSNDVI